MFESAKQKETSRSLEFTLGKWKGWDEGEDEANPVKNFKKWSMTMEAGVERKVEKPVFIWFADGGMNYFPWRRPKLASTNSNSLRH